MISTESQPSPANRSRQRLVLAAPMRGRVEHDELAFACFADSAVLRPSRRTFFCRPKSWLRTTGPKITRPATELRRAQAALARPAGALLLQGFLVVPWISLMPFVLCVPARRLASCQLTTRARMSRRTGSPNTSSASSMSPTSSLSRLRTTSFMARLPAAALSPGAGAPRSAAGNGSSSGALRLAASLTQDKAAGAPGTAPSTMMRPRSASAETTSRFCVVTRAAP